MGITNRLQPNILKWKPGPRWALNLCKSSSSLGPCWATWALHPEEGNLCICWLDRGSRGEAVTPHGWQYDALWAWKPGPDVGHDKGISWTTRKAVSAKGQSPHGDMVDMVARG
jgi:hypothetical protein